MHLVDNIILREKNNAPGQLIQDLFGVAETFIQNSFSIEGPDLEKHLALNERAAKLTDNTIDWLAVIAMTDNEEELYYAAQNNVSPAHIASKVQKSAQTYIQAVAALSLLKSSKDEVMSNPGYQETLQKLFVFENVYQGYGYSIVLNPVETLVENMSDIRRALQPKKAKDQGPFSGIPIFLEIEENTKMIKQIMQSAPFTGLDLS